MEYYFEVHFLRVLYEHVCSMIVVTCICMYGRLDEAAYL